MAAATIMAIADDLKELMRSSPFALQEAKEPFSFRLQPNTQLDSVFCLLTDSRTREDYLGEAEAVIDRVMIRVARKLRRDPQAAISELQATISSMSVVIGRHQPASPDYSARVTDWTLPQPAAGEDYAVAEIEVLVDYDSVL